MKCEVQNASWGHMWPLSRSSGVFVCVCERCGVECFRIEVCLRVDVVAPFSVLQCISIPDALFCRVASFEMRTKNWEYPAVKGKKGFSVEKSTHAKKK
jgi:hypothetical protein